VEFTVEKRHWGWIALGFLIVAVALVRGPRIPHFIAADTVWREAMDLGAEFSLDPELIFLIAFAESSLNAHADVGYARGLMQISDAAWRETTTQSYQNAFLWRRNMRVATQYLAYLRDRLVEAGQFDNRHLAAAYRFGYGALAEQKFAVGRLPKPSNEIYQKIFANRPPSPTQYGVSPRLVGGEER
jgi:hypothetical protein